MGNYGMKVSRQGFDVKTCADHQLLFSSSFKFPMYTISGTATITTLDSDQTIVTHNLGYIPIFFCLIRNEPPPSSATDATNRLHWHAVGASGDSPAPTIVCDTTKIYYKANQYVNTLYVAYFIMPYNLEASFSAPNIDLTVDTQGTITTDWGFKVSKDGQDVKTATQANLQSFSGSSSGGYPVRHQIIHKVGTVTGVTGGSTVSIAHGLGYKPFFLWYWKTSSSPKEYALVQTTHRVYAGPPIELQLVVRTWADNTNVNLYYNMAGTYDFAYVIFKDPLT